MAKQTKQTGQTGQSGQSVGDRFVVRRHPMICGSAEAESRPGYTMVTDGKGCVWMYSLSDRNPGETVYMHDPDDEHSDGFGGRVITFRIGKCAEYRAKGPWHSNSDALFNATGVDIRDKHLTFAVVAMERTREGPPGYDTVLEKLLYIDTAPQLGEFNRGQSIAQMYADDLGKQVFYYSESSGGSSCGPVYPKGQAPWELKARKG